jgi:hypothetical protein
LDFARYAHLHPDGQRLIPGWLEGPTPRDGHEGPLPALHLPWIASTDGPLASLAKIRRAVVLIHAVSSRFHSPSYPLGIAVLTEDEFKALRRAGKGFIYNDFARRGAGGAEYNVLHYADCETLDRAKASVPKYHFASQPEAVAWLENNRGAYGERWRRCENCFG